ncbi:MAG: 2-amino-4-hydroxy-6-hydroxymethyldihydropteridine diphosphokinase [Gammaproteobacteria bacterium]|nr:MAG: 2-amino-4-hydroxy-6-hydroxymethyldihydropteridine diphosphokinase [Gammaproteobacteria bacterium]UCH40210.1 MAG: 2-amino-4-hydroxy-6-hydroxymethyldihydropteridine diphosphokinase [Gammaproteobacteria bacterium]
MPAEEVFIGIGSNIGDSIIIVEEAIDAIGNIQQCKLRGRSSLYRSTALGDIPQDDYINAVVKLETGLEPLQLLLELQAIEHAYYRKRDSEPRWGPRTLDLDIILFGNRVFEDSHLRLPHPEFSQRPFVLVPMFEIGGDRFVPGFGSLSYLIQQAPELAMEKLEANDA